MVFRRLDAYNSADMKRMQNLTRYQPQAKPGRRRNANRLTVVIVAAALAAAGFIAWSMLQQRDRTEVPVAEKRQTEAQVSGKGGFSIMLPEGWNVIREKNADRFMVTGMVQPEFKPGQRAMVTDTDVIGSDGALVFIAEIANDLPPPRGEATDFMVGRGDELLSGKRFVHTFEQDEAVSSGVLRSKGDLDYVFTFPLGGRDGKRELRVRYSVYADDPRNNIERVDAAVRSIRLLR
jgi:hypothetical protein